MRILGLSAFYHDSAAAFVCDGEIIAAAQEERFTRKKHDARFPHYAVQYCLEEAGVKLDAVDHVVFYEKPFLKFERLIETYLAFAPRGLKSFRMAMPLWIHEKLFQKDNIARALRQHGNFDIDKFLFAEHHQSHAASAFFPSPFSKAAILTMDGVGEWPTTSAAVGEENQISIIKEIHFPHSLGLLYSAFTYHAGFKVNSGEYKLMGLAPYGVPKYAGRIRDKLIDVKTDGSFHLNLEYFDYCTGFHMTSRRFDELFDGPARKSEDLITQREMDLAASVQVVLEEVVLKLTRALAAETSARNLCLAGGVALNCVANSKILKDGAFERIWIQPASGDAGGAVGAALAAHHIFHAQPRRISCNDLMKGSYLGPKFATEDVQQRLAAAGARFTVLADNELIGSCVRALTEGKALGWFQGRMEFGPRALGARSILADARSAAMQSILNLRVKYRESFRPFAPAVLREDLENWFELETDSPYMLLVADVVKSRRKCTTLEEQTLFGIEKLRVPRSDVPAVTHIDYSARIQTVHRETNPQFHMLLSVFKESTGCPVIVNTSFNIRGEPIVCTPEDAFRCFMGTEIETLAIENCFLRKEDQDASLRRDYTKAFDPD
jgi:carbamoyltransferase